MDGYPNSDEEFELTYGDELQLIREQEDIEESLTNFQNWPNIPHHINQTCIQQGVANSSSANEVTLQNNSSSIGQLITSQNNTLECKQIGNKTDNRINEVIGSKKRSIQELFGEIDDILCEEIVEGRTKKAKNCMTDDLILINHIIELRKLSKERHNLLEIVNTDRNINEIERRNISYQVPLYSFIVVTRDDGKRVYVRCHSEQYEKEEMKKIVKTDSSSGIMGEAFKEIWKEAEATLGRAEPQSSEMMETNSSTISFLKESQETNTHLWVDLYKPRKYLELLSDESTNRLLLRWLKLWDKIVFNRLPKQKIIKTEVKGSDQKFKKQELNMNLDEYGRPQHKIVLLCGPPGLGKTTLAHMIARHAGYNVVEVNASDDRSTEKFKTVLENATQMRSVIDKENRPNCLVFDEIDGAPAASIEFLIKFVSGAANTKKKKATKQTANILKRPIICICNDVYVPALRPLRQVAFVVNFPPTASERLAERLNEIARHQKIKTDLGALLALCEKSGNDIRSCLTVLHFFKSLSKPITLLHIYKTNVGQKDMQKGLFSVWQDIFQIKRPKHMLMSTNTSDRDTKNINYLDLNYRSCNILQVVRSFGDYERLAQGVFENYPTMRIKDTTLSSTCEALEWFCFTDTLNKNIHSFQNYSLLSYLPYAFVIWHYVFSNVGWQKLTYPTAGYEAKMKASKNDALLAEVMKGMQPSVRAFTYSNSLRLDILPILSEIIVPVLRPVNLHLYTQQEREQLNQVVSVMIDYNLNYIQERMPEGNYVYAIDPNIDELTSIPGFKPKRMLSYSNKQLIAREIEVEKMRRTELHKVCNSGENRTNTSKEMGKLPNHLQKLKTKTIKPKTATVVKDFFGRIVTTTTATGKIGPDVKNDIWYQFKEGYNNAVRKRIKISSLK